jgi:uncharacterized protein with HEPN domain
VPRRDWKFRIRDILDAVEKIKSYTAGMNREAFGADNKTVDAVVYNLSVIGEAACHVPDHVQERYPDIPWQQMRGIRNVVVHQYFGVSVDILWETVRRDLPLLEPLLRQVLADQV